MRRARPASASPNEAIDRIPAAVLERPVSGWNLSGGTLRNEIGAEATLLVFLRHFG